MSLSDITEKKRYRINWFTIYSPKPYVAVIYQEHVRQANKYRHSFALPDSVSRTSARSTGHDAAAMEMRWSRGSRRNTESGWTAQFTGDTVRRTYYGVFPRGCLCILYEIEPVAAMRKWRAEGKKRKGRGRGRWGRGCEFAIKGWITSGRTWCVFPRRGIRLSRTWFKIFPIAPGMADVAAAAIANPRKFRLHYFPFLTARDKGECHVRLYFRFGSLGAHCRGESRLLRDPPFDRVYRAKRGTDTTVFWDIEGSL